MKINRSYLLGLGSGLVLSAMLTVLLPAFGVQLFPDPSANKPGAINQQVSTGAKPAANKNREQAGSTGQTNSAEQTNSTGQSVASNSSNSNSNSENQNQANSASPANPVNSANPATGATASGTASAGNSTNSNNTSGVNQPGSVTERSFVVPNSATAERIAVNLAAEGLIPDQNDFLAEVQKRGVASRFQAGTFSLSTGLTVDELINRLLQKD